jgi:hypothetical protein
LNRRQRHAFSVDCSNVTIVVANFASIVLDDRFTARGIAASRDGVDAGGRAEDPRL